MRVSGPQAGLVLTTLAGKLPAPRLASRRLLRDAARQPIDDAVVLWFPGPGSATGEDIAEFHVHGGRAVLAALLAAISVIPNTRAAEPGEFTAALSRTASSTSPRPRASTISFTPIPTASVARRCVSCKGLLGNRARDWRERIIEASALIEAGIDFSDEGDVPAELMAPAVKAIKTLYDEITEVLAAQGQAERLRDGLVVAIAGEPNVGKSTLINQLARREVAIVSPHAGTTRDVIEVQLDLDGYPVTVIDTAGIRETDDPVEQEGVRRARARAEDADLVLWLVEGEQAVDRSNLSDGAVWIVRNKIDLGGISEAGPRGEFEISASRGDGIPELVDALVKFAAEFFGTSEGAVVTRARQRDLLRRASDSLRRSLELVEEGEELAAEELRAAAYVLGRLLGRVDVEDVLGAIFQKFCIGK